MFSHLLFFRGGVSRATSTRSTWHLIESLERRTLFAGAGELDPGFSSDGITTYTPPGSNAHLEFATAMDIRNGRIVVAGTTDSPTTGRGRVSLAAFDLSGKPDTTFSGDGFQMQDFSRPFGAVDVAILPDSRLLVLGVGFLAKLNAGGGRSTSFGGGDGEVDLPFDGGATSMAIAPGGKIVVAGTNADHSIGIARFNADGSPDATFGGGDGVALFADVGVYLFTGPDVAVQSDGRILFTASDPGEMPDSPIDDFDSAVFRLELDGDLDPTFAGGTGRMELDFGDDEALNSIALDAQGRIILGGHDESYRFAFVARLLASGQIDPGFSQTRIDNSFDVVDLVVAPDGKIVVATWSDRGLVARLNVNGGFDTSFGAGDGYLSGNGGDTSMFAMDVQPDGKIVTAAGGNFVTVARRFASANSQPSVEGSLQLTNGVVRYTGTAGNDEVRVSTNSFGKYSLATRFTTQEFPGSVTSFDLRGNAGDDSFFILGDIFLNDRLEGGLGNDKLRGGGGNDLLKGQEGNDELFGGDGSDTLDGGQGTDYQDGGDGADTIDYSLRNSAVYVDLEGDADDGPAGENDRVVTIEHILGGRGNDILIGDALPNFIRGNGGDDTIAGRDNNDTLKGDAGRDKLYGDAGNDFLDALDNLIDFIIDGGLDTDTAKKDPNDPITSIELLA